MARVKQFADDLGISKNKAQSLINKGRSRKDGGSQILESVMADKDKKKKKTKKQLQPDIKGGRAKRDDDEKQLQPDIEGGRAKNFSLEELKEMGIDPRTMSNGGSNVTKINKGISGKAKVAQFKNIQNAVSAGKITQREAERKIREIVLSKKAGGTYKRKDGGGFPDLTGDGKTTQADILKGRGVPGFSRGGGMAIQGLGFKGIK